LTGKSAFENNLILGSNSKNNQIKASNPAALAAITAKLTGANVFDPTLYAAAVVKDGYKYSADVAGSAYVGTPDFTLVSGSIAASGASFSHAKLASGFENVPYKGAFGTVNWAAGWAHFDPQSLPYTTPGAVK